MSSAPSSLRYDVKVSGATRRYLDDAAKLLAAGPSREEFFAKTLAMYPDRVNPFTVWLNATRLLSA